MSIHKSSIIAGTMNWGAWGRKFNISAIQERIETFLTEDITTFDHADIYGGYTTEADFGTAWAEMNIDRKEVKFITKCGIKYVCEERDYSIKHYDYTKEHIIWSVENSLKNLQTEYIDVLLLHRPSPLMETEVIAEAITELKNSEKILAFGLSNFTPSQTDLIKKYNSVACNQIQFSATHLEPMLNGELDYMSLHNIQPMAWNPLGSFYKEAIPKTIRLRNLLQKLTEKYGLSNDLLLLAWVLKHPAAIQPVVGTTQMDRIKNLKKLHGFELELEDWFAIWTESIGTKIP
ncbi:aldo/keto reductase family oxidoreductase [Flavobacterium sp.]|jgi:predicted oxidoreductase|uniref:aldo/keto reductase family oxidoreductase n=1 Tax=Flavobacterium sp. TaxID=239 RepID=UPI0037BF4F72